MPISNRHKKKTLFSQVAYIISPRGFTQASWRWRLWATPSCVLTNFSGSRSLLGDVQPHYWLLTAQKSESKLIQWFVMWKQCGSCRVWKAPECVDQREARVSPSPAQVPPSSWSLLSPDMSQPSIRFVNIREELSSACGGPVFDPGPKSRSVVTTLDKEIYHAWKDKTICWTFKLYFSGSRIISEGHNMVVKDQGLPRPVLSILASP